MKKLILIFSLLISGCMFSKTYHLEFFYASTCPRCHLFKTDVIPYLEDKYPNLSVTLHDIDEEESLDLYAKTISLLKDYKVDDDTGSVPFIVLDGCFVKIGYSNEEKDLFLKNIDKAMNDEQISLSTDYYLFQEGKTLY